MEVWNLYSNAKGKRKYVVSSFGNVKLVSGKKVYMQRNSGGYLGPMYGPRFKWHGPRTHRMVAKLFVSNPRPDIFTVVDHIDRDRTNNHFKNLRWLSPELNSLNRMDTTPDGATRFKTLYSELTGLCGCHHEIF